MNDEESAQAPAPEPKQQPTKLNSIVRRIEGYLQERRAKQENETPSDRASRHTAIATIWIAVFTFVSIGVAASQFIAMRGQLDEMRRQGELTEELIDHPIWLMGIKNPVFGDPKNKGVATAQVIVKNAGKQLGIVELLVGNLIAVTDYTPPTTDFGVDRTEPVCGDFTVGERTILAGQQKEFRFICIPIPPTGHTPIVTRGKHVFFKIMMIYYDERRVAHERTTLFFLYQAHDKVPATFVAFGSTDVKIPEDQTYKIREMERDYYAHIMRVQDRSERMREQQTKKPTPQPR